MINIVFVLLAKRAFSDITEGVDSKNVSLILLVWSSPPSHCMNKSINLWLITYTISLTFKVVKGHSGMQVGRVLPSSIFSDLPNVICDS